MKTKMHAMYIIGNVFRETLRAVPFSGILGIVNYILQGLLPAMITIVSARLFELSYSNCREQNVINQMFLYGAVLVGIYALTYVVEFIASITINAGIYERCTSHYKRLISEKTVRLSLIDFENAEILNLQNRAKDCVNREILSQLYMSLTILITSGISMLSTISVLSMYSMWFLPVSVFSVVPYFVSRVIRGKEFYRLKKTQAKKMRRLNYLWSLFGNKRANKEMRVMGFSTYLYDRWVETRDEVNEELWLQNIKDGKSLLLCDTFKIAGYAFSVLLALMLVLDGVISIGVFGACIAAFKAMQESAKAFLIEFGNLPEKIAFSGDYFSFLKLPEESDGNEKIDGLNQKIVLSKVNFSYPGSEKKALNDISLVINKGEKVVVLGVNGSGKTTLSKLILGLYPQEAGEIRYDGISVDKIQKVSLYSMISMVAQNYVRYNLTLRENVAISDLNNLGEDEKITNILKESGLEQLLREKNALEQVVGREFSGLEFSGGQWQKIAIARALFKDSDVVILDEPTSALDPVIETEILTQFVKLAKEKTAIIISHRVGLCKIADKIIVMKDGRICEMGTHGSLIDVGGEYAKLYYAQEQWYA